MSWGCAICTQNEFLPLSNFHGCSQMFNILKNSKAASPVIGLVLMVSFTIILAAVAVAAFGLNPLSKAPQADIRAVCDDIGSGAVIKLMHQGGEQITLVESRTSIIISDSSSADGMVAFDNLFTEVDQKFIAGDSVYLYFAGGNVCVGNSSLSNADSIDIAQNGEIINVKVLDVDSQQMIADMKVNF